MNAYQPVIDNSIDIQQPLAIEMSQENLRGYGFSKR